MKKLTRRVLHGQSLSHGLWKRLSQSVCTISLIPENGKNSSIVAVPITNATLVQPLFYPVNFLDDQNALFDTVRLKITRKVRYVRVEAKRLEFVNLMASNAARSSHMPSSTAGVPSVPTTPSLSPKSASNYTSHAISLPSYYHLLPFGVSTSHLCLADDNPVATPPHLHTRSVTKAPRPAPPTVQVKANMMNTEKSTLDKVVFQGPDGGGGNDIATSASMASLGTKTAYNAQCSPTTSYNKHNSGTCTRYDLHCPVECSRKEGGNQSGGNSPLSSPVIPVGEVNKPVRKSHLMAEKAANKVVILGLTSPANHAHVYSSGCATCSMNGHRVCVCGRDRDEEIVAKSARLCVDPIASEMHHLNPLRLRHWKTAAAGPHECGTDGDISGGRGWISSDVPGGMDGYCSGSDGFSRLNSHAMHIRNQFTGVPNGHVENASLDCYCDSRSCKCSLSTGASSLSDRHLLQHKDYLSCSSSSSTSSCRSGTGSSFIPTLVASQSRDNKLIFKDEFDMDNGRTNDLQQGDSCDELSKIFYRRDKSSAHVLPLAQVHQQQSHSRRDSQAQSQSESQTQPSLSSQLSAPLSRHVPHLTLTRSDRSLGGWMASRHCSVNSQSQDQSQDQLQDQSQDQSYDQFHSFESKSYSHAHAQSQSQTCKKPASSVSDMEGASITRFHEQSHGDAIRMFVPCTSDDYGYEDDSNSEASIQTLSSLTDSLTRTLPLPMVSEQPIMSSHYPRQTALQEIPTTADIASPSSGWLKNRGNLDTLHVHTSPYSSTSSSMSSSVRKVNFPSDVDANTDPTAAATSFFEAYSRMDDIPLVTRPISVKESQPVIASPNPSNIYILGNSSSYADGASSNVQYRRDAVQSCAVGGSGLNRQQQSVGGFEDALFVGRPLTYTWEFDFRLAEEVFDSDTFSFAGSMWRLTFQRNIPSAHSHLQPQIAPQARPVTATPRAAGHSRGVDERLSYGLTISQLSRGQADSAACVRIRCDFQLHCDLRTPYSAPPLSTSMRPPLSGSGGGGSDRSEVNRTAAPVRMSSAAPSSSLALSSSSKPNAAVSTFVFSPCLPSYRGFHHFIGPEVMRYVAKNGKLTIKAVLQQIMIY